jgi:hypothetical protein
MAASCVGIILSLLIIIPFTMAHVSLTLLGQYKLGVMNSW